MFDTFFLREIDTSVDIPTDNNRDIHISLLPNPSHLETVNPMCVGKARARLHHRKCHDYSASASADGNSPVLPIQIHGDAALAGKNVF